MASGVAPLEMTKWFDTNYHYLVPELGPDTEFRLAGDKPLSEYREARALVGIETRPVLLGPLSFLLLAKPAEPGFRPLDLLDPLLDVYAELLGKLAEAGAGWVQLDEPVLAADRTEGELDALGRACQRLGSLPTSLPPEVAGRLAFARQKVDEVVAIGRALTDSDAFPAQPVPVANAEVRARLAALGAGPARTPYAVRAAVQAPGLPLLPTTTIGSFPQTAEIRAARASRSRTGTVGSHNRVPPASRPPQT